MSSRIDMFLKHLDVLSDGVKPRFFPVEAESPDAPRITTIIYSGLPETGGLIGITYGLSLASHPEWTVSKPELCICVNSADDRWAHAIGHLAAQLAGDCPFHYGDTLNFGEQISPESAMTAFVVFAPAILDRADYTDINVGGELPVSLAALYPIYDIERQYIHSHGLEAFWQLGWNPYDVTRPPAV